MKKLTVMALAAALAFFATAWPGHVEQLAYADRGGQVVRGGGGVRGGSGEGRFVGRGAGGSIRDGGRGFSRGGDWGHRRHGGADFDVWIGPGWGWGWGWDPFYYPYYSYPYYYNQAPVVIQQPQEYVLPETSSQEPAYWYYCKESNGYYPYVKRCPGGWLRVVPTPAPDQEQ